MVRSHKKQSQKPERRCRRSTVSAAFPEDQPTHSAKIAQNGPGVKPTGPRGFPECARASKAVRSLATWTVVRLPLFFRA